MLRRWGVMVPEHLPSMPYKHVTFGRVWNLGSVTDVCQSSAYGVFLLDWGWYTPAPIDWEPFSYEGPLLPNGGDLFQQVLFPRMIKD